MKKILSTILISLVTLVLVACGDTSQNKTTDEKTVAENASSGNWLEGKRFSAQVSESELKEWIGNLQ